MLISPELQQKLRTQYNPDGSNLRRAQLRMVDMLKFIDEFCTKHNITYWLDYGTLLGAARHGGFIPWDDDTDIAMPIKDLLKFKKLLLKEGLPQELALQCKETDSYYWINWITLRDLNSKQIRMDDNTILEECKFKGIYIDIFAVEEMSIGVRRFINMIYDKLIYRPSIYKKWYHKLLKKSRIISLFFLCYMLIPFFRFIPYKRVKNAYFPSYGIPFYKKRRKSDIYPLKRISFEGFEFNAPHNTESYLKSLYGIWEKIPPVPKRKIHGDGFCFNK